MAFLSYFNGYLICILDHIFLFPTILIYKNCAVLFKIKTKALCFLGR